MFFSYRVFILVTFIFFVTQVVYSQNHFELAVDNMKRYAIVEDTMRMNEHFKTHGLFWNVPLLLSLKAELLFQKQPTLIAQRKKQFELLLNDSLSLANYYYLLGGYYINEYKYDSALNYLNKSDSLLENSNAKVLKSLINRNIAACYSNKGDFYKAINYYEKANTFNVGNDVVKNYIDLSIATTYKDYSYYDSALSYLLRLENVFDENNNYKLLASVHTRLAEVYINLGKYYRAKNYLNKVLGAPSEKTIDKIKVRALIALSTMEHTDTALMYLDSAISIANKNNYNKLLLYSFLNKSAKLLDIGQYNKSLSYLRSSEQLNKVVNDYTVESAIYSNYGSLYMQSKQFQKARGYFKKSLLLSFKYNITDGILYNQKKIAEVFEEQRKFEEAFAEFKLYKFYQDSLFNTENNAKINALEEQVRLERAQKKQKGLKLVRFKENALREKYYFFTVLLILFMVLTILFLFFKNRLYKKNNELQLLKINSLKGVNKSVSKQLSHQKALLVESKTKIDEWKALLRKNSGAEDLTTSILEMLNKVKKTQNDWDDFFEKFEILNSNILSDLKSKHTNLTGYDMRHIALIKLNFSISESSSILSVTEDSVKKARYRLKKKMNLNKADSLKRYLNEL